MAMKSKRRHIEDVFPPAEIREQTRARRAWVEAMIAEQNALPGREAKSVGTGSYQHVSVWAVEQVAATLQTRGTCQCCGGDVAVVSGKVAHHGYKRPGYGWQTSSCSGARHRPYEQAHDALDRLIAALEREEQARTAKVVALRAGNVSELAVRVGWGRKARVEMVRAPNFAEIPELRNRTWHGLLQDALNEAERDLSYLRADLAAQRTRREAWKPNQPLRTVLV